jgi:hypothetical protein
MMLRSRDLCCIALLFLVAAPGSAAADTLTVGITPHEGRFLGFDKHAFRFRTDGGRTLTEPRSSVQRLALPEPVSVTLVRSGNRSAEVALLVGYHGGAFTIERGGRRERVFGTQVRAIEVRAGAPARADDADKTAGRGEPAPIATAALHRRPDLSVAQRAALRDYERTREEYDAFVARSSAMVAALKQSRGRQRDRLLNALRERNIAEQGVKRRLRSARAGLLRAFPELAEERGEPAGELGPVTGPLGRAGRVVETTTLTLTLPETGANEVVLLDTDFLHQLGPLEPARQEAIARYEAAKRTYREEIIAPDTVLEPGRAAELRGRLAKAQQELFAAFPEVKIIRE